MMRSLSVKLTLAFLAVGIAGAALVAFFVGFRTRIEFNSFVDTQSHLDMAVILGNYYEENGGWEDVNSFIHQDSAFSFHEARLILLDADNIVLYGFGPENDGKPYPFDRLPPSQPIEVNGETVGQLILNPDDNYISPPDRFSPEDSFLRNVNLAAVASAITASVFALALGLLYVLFLERMTASPELRGAVLIGLLGSFTTFSTFSIETLNLIEQAEYMKAGLNMLLSVFACLIAAWFGLVVGRQI